MSTSVKRALHILLRLAEEPQTISDLGRHLEIHRATALRLIRTLEEERFVRRREDGRCQLGPRMLTLAQAAVETGDLASAAAPHLNALGRRCGHTIHLAGLSDGVIIYLDKVESRHTIRMYSRIGATSPPHATGVGKVILAYQSPEGRAMLLGSDPLKGFTDNTFTDRPALDAELERIAVQGWALDDCEHEPFIQCVAAPVRTATGAVVAAVSVSVPNMVVDREDLLRLVPDVTSAAHAVSAELGWTPDE